VKVFLATERMRTGGGLGPGLVELDEGVEDLGVGLVALFADEEAPGLLVVAGGGPGGCGEDLGEVFGGDWLFGEGARGPALEDDVGYAGGGWGVLEGFEVLGHWVLSWRVGCGVTPAPPPAFTAGFTFWR